MNNAALNTYEPDYVSPPGETLEELLEERGMTQASLATRLGYSKKTVNEIIQAKAALTPDFALALERVFGTPASFWNRREQIYREYIARMNELEKLEQHLNWLDQIPYKAMINQGWIQKFQTKTDQLIEVLNFFGVTSPVEWEKTWEKKLAFNFRKAQDSHEFALIAWLRQGEILANQIQCKPYSKRKFKTTLEKIRELSCTDPEFYKDELVKRCAECGVAVVFVPELPKTKVWGVTHWLTSSKALIQLSLRYKKDDHFWFSFFHEAGHVLLHSKKEVFIEDERKTEQETEADNFAQELLIPKKVWNEIADIFPYSTEIIESYAKELAISPGIIVGRLQREKKLPWTHLNKLKQSCQWLEN